MEKKRAKVRGDRDIQARNYECCQHFVQVFAWYVKLNLD